MKKCWFNSMLSNKKLEHRCGLSKSMDSLDALGHTGGSEENDAEKKIPSWDSSSLSNINYLNSLFDSRNIWSLISDDTFLVRNSNGDSYSLYFDIENQIFDIDNAISFLSELDIFFSNSLNSGSNSNNYYSYYSMYDTQSNWNNHINSCIDTYLSFEISLNSDIYSGIDSYIKSLICTVCTESKSTIESENLSIKTSNSSFNENEIEISENEIEISNNFDNNFDNFDITTKYRQLWVQCENCYGLNYKKFFGSKMNICEHCGYHLNMSSSDRIKLFIDPDTWESMDENMVSIDPIEFLSEEESYRDRISFYQKQTGLTEAVQTGVGKLNSIPIAIGVMDFQFMGGSMGSVVGEKITRLIEYATNRSLPVIIVCASGGARMQEGSLSLMQMAKISSASYDYQSKKKLFYVSILTSPTTGGVTASFGMLGDIIIAEPNAYIAFTGKRVIEQTLKKTVPEGSQVAEYSFHKGLFDPIVPRNPLKGVLNELFQLHGFLPLNQD
uniref:Acetyl-coenzyme A carboxylase carboxyl transferase subunit beta, chloroplastic n=1 Tax=Goodyera schlechtendaliana TaxID=164262 RepID=A0A1Y1CUL2_9ASPA|nr:acetyl-CoA carboxylase carboxyltransferase beta subunit [Goodyera schlechtendaliana]UNB13797.1 acetyl-CoA carboxylase carboxyltransferase beta subunit [Goodyera schlechtendaliana]BAX84099.1 acetyl-CoA carboxylase carboxyl transferase [Goodyera schlechtendaliana]BAX88010.1 acetyl-CoA carboxylase carboxyl transferase [Goodyera schlechtendaliana]